MSIDPEQLRIALRVLAQATELDPDDPDALALRRATAGLYKSVKQHRRKTKRQAVAEADRAEIGRAHV